MITLRVDSRGVERLAKNWPEAARKAQRDAMRGVLFRLKERLRAEFEAGIGPETRDPLTRMEQARVVRKAQALSTLGRVIAYAVDELGADSFQGRVGLGESVKRRGKGEGEVKRLKALFAGGDHVVTEKRQKEILMRLLVRAVREFRTRSSGGSAKRGKSARWLKRFRAISASLRFDDVLPKVGTVLEWPERDWVRKTVREQGRALRSEYRILYHMALRGMRWS